MPLRSVRTPESGAPRARMRRGFLISIVVVVGCMLRSSSGVLLGLCVDTCRLRIGPGGQAGKHHALEQLHPKTFGSIVTSFVNVAYLGYGASLGVLGPEGLVKHGGTKRRRISFS
jgi:hypothetical protein